MAINEISLQLPYKGNEIDCIVTEPVNKVRGAVLLVHGLGGQKNSDTHLALIPLLTACDFATLRFDFLGHGESDGSTFDLTIGSGTKQVEAADVALRERFPNVSVGHFGASFGATAILMSADICANSTAIVSRSPVSDYAKVRCQQLGDEGMKRWEQDGYVDTLISGNRKIPWAFYQEALLLDLFAQASTSKAPLLIAQGTCDSTVPMDDTVRLHSLWKGRCDLLQIEGGDHSLSDELHMKIFVGAAANWLQAHFS